MKSVLIIMGIMLISAAQVMAGNSHDKNLPGKEARASDYSLGSNILRGEVLAIDGNEVSLRDSSIGKSVKVTVADEISLANIEPGDRVRVSFSTDPKVAAKVTKENEE